MGRNFKVREDLTFILTSDDFYYGGNNKLNLLVDDALYEIDYSVMDPSGSRILEDLTTKLTSNSKIDKIVNNKNLSIGIFPKDTETMNKTITATDTNGFINIYSASLDSKDYLQDPHHLTKIETMLILKKQLIKSGDFSNCSFKISIVSIFVKCSES
jgi:hypothetical protein